MALNQYAGIFRERNGQIALVGYDAVKLAKYLLLKGAFKTDIKTDVMFWQSPNGVWLPFGDRVIHKTLTKCLDNHYQIKTRKFVEDFIRGETLFSLEEALKASIDLVPVQNGVLNVITKVLQPYGKNHFFMYMLPIDFDPPQKCPDILRVLKEIVDDNQLVSLQEAIGYTFYGGCEHKKGFWMTGKGVATKQGNNGKSLILDLLMKMLGQAVSTLTAQQIEYEKFDRAQLVGKTANICHDVPVDSLKSVGTLKMVVAGNEMTVEEKNHPAYSIKPHCKLWFASNGFPIILHKDDNDGWWNRWVVFICKHQFKGSNDDKELFRKIATPEALSGLLNWALEGLDRVLKQGYISSVNETQLEWIKQSNSAKAFFMEEYIIEETGVHIELGGLNNIYKQWCRDNEVSEVTPFSFKVELRRNFGSAVEIVKNIRGSSVRVIENIRLDVTKTPLEYLELSVAKALNKALNGKSVLEKVKEVTENCESDDVLQF